MAETTITALPGGSTPSGSEKIVVDQGGVTKNLSLSDLFQQGGEETVTSLTLSNGVLSYEAEDGNTTDINLGTDSLSSDWDTNTPNGGNKLYIKDMSVHSNYDPFGSGSDVDANQNYSLDKSRFPLIITSDNNETDGPNSHGIVLYNASGTTGSFAPSILFASRETGTTDFRAATAGIYCRSPIGEGGASGGSNYGDGELIFATSGVLTGDTANSEGVTQRMVIDRAGRVGINVIAPTEVLDVDGNIKASGNVTTIDPTSTNHAATKNYVDNSSTDGFSPTSYAGEESVTLPNGLIMKWGSLSMSGSSTSTVTFASAFSTIVNAQVSWQIDNTNSTNPVRLQGPITNSELEIRNTMSQPATVYWQAVGY